MLGGAAPCRVSGRCGSGWPGAIEEMYYEVRVDQLDGHSERCAVTLRRGFERAGPASSVQICAVRPSPRLRACRSVRTVFIAFFFSYLLAMYQGGSALLHGEFFR